RRMTSELTLIIWIIVATLAFVSVAYLLALLVPAILIDRGTENAMTNDRHYISGGHVFCPVRREDADIESCFACGSLKELNDVASPPFIACRPPRAALATEADALYLA